MTWTITALSNSTVSEGGSVSYRLSRTHTGVETVYLSTWQNWNGSGVYNGKDTSGGATNAAGPDYTPFDTTNGIAFSASQSIYDFTISTLDNNSVTESTETFGIVARTQANWAANAPTFLASNTFTILDNDPVNTAPSVSISAGSSYAAGTVLTGDLLFTASDAQGVGDIDYIKVFDANETSGAEWRYAGALIHPGGGSAGYAFEYANRASLTYKVGAGANDFQIQAFDNAGLPSNAPVVQITGTVTVTNTAPSVLIIAGSSYAAGTVLTGDLLFTASDAQGVGDIDYIKVFDANETSGAEWRYAGALIHPGGGSAGYAFEYANRASLTYKVGAGANDFQVQAFDNATLPSNAPVVQITGTGSQALSVTGPTTFSLAANQTISGAQFFQQNGIIWGGSVATIRLHDTIVGQGFFKLGGVSKAGVQTFDVAVQNLSQLTYETGAVGGSNQFSIEVLDSAGNASNALLTTATVTFSSATKSGGAIIQEALLHLGQEYFWGVSPGQSAYSNPNYAGPWDCSEFVSWLVNKVYGEQIGLRTWNAYTGYWVEDAAAGAKLHYISMDDARNTPGAIIFRFDDQQHHIAISEGNGKLIEANVNYHDGYYWSDDGTPHAPLSDGSAPTGVDIGDVKERSFDAGTYSAAMGWKAVEINDVQYTTATVVVTPATETDDYSDASRSTTGRLIVGGAATPGKIETAGDKDWFKIDNLVAGTSYKIVVTGTGTNALGNSFFSVRDDAGNWVTGDASRQGGQSYDDAFGNTNAAVEFTAATSGAYYVVVGGGGVNFASQKGDYQVSGQAISEPANSSAGSATAITLNGAPIQAYVGFGGDTADYYSFTATQTGKITVNLTGLGADIDAVVLNGAGQQIDTLVSSTANAEQRTAAVTAGVTYKIQVAPHSPGPSSQQSSYAIDVGFTTGTTTSTGSGAGLKKADDLFRDNGGKLVTLAEFALASYDVQSWEPLGAFTNDTKVGAHEAFGTLTGLGWQPLQALGTLASPNPSRPVDFQDGFQNGFFASGNSAVLIARAGDALVISFRGTNDNDLSMLTAQLSLTKDEISWYNMSKYYTLLKPLIDQVDAYVANAANGISKIYAIGHSLGAAMVDEFMTTHPRNTAPGSVSYEAVIFAHPDFNDAGASLEIAAANALIAVATTPSFLTLAEGVLDVWLTARAGVPDFHPASDSRITSFHNDTDIINIADFDGKGLIPADENTLVDGILNPGTSHSMLLYLRAMQFLLKEGIPENDVIGLINGTNVDYDRLVYNATKIADGNGNPIDFVIGDGPDTLAGSTSNDILIGGKGDDTYTFSSLLPWGNDTVVDSDGADVIDIGNTNGNLSVSSDGRDLVLKFTPSVLSPGLLSGGTVRISGYFDPDGKHAIETLRWNGVNNQLSEIVTNGNKHFDPLVDSVVATVNATVAGAKATLNAAEWAGSSIYANIKTGTSKFYDTAKNWFVANVSILDATLGDEDSVIGKTVTLSGISNIIGTQYNDKLVGDDGENDLNGAAGNDLIQGGAGNDNIDGGAGTDTVLFSGGFANYRVTYFSDARTFTIEDLRAGQLDGTDTVTGIENFQFADDIITNATLQPDFAEYVSVANATVAAGGSATIDAYAMNVGKSEVGASTAQIYLSTDAIITTSDTLLTTVNSGALKAVGQTGYYDRQTLSVTLATDLAPGTYYIGGIADYDNRVSEGNETNNTYNVAKITVTGRPRPDLTEYVAISNTTVAAGGGATIEAYAMNVGDGVSGASTAKIYLSTDATITTSDIELATVNSGALTSVGQTGYYDHQTLSVSFAANLAPGTYYVGGIADYNNQVSESNEANNTYNVTKITVAGPAQPDLSEYVSVSNTTVAAGGSTTIDAYAMNIGSGASGASTAKIYLSTDATITSSDAVLGTVNSGALTSVGQTGYYDRQTLSVSFAANLAPGTYYIGGIADDGNQVSESNEANNTYNVTKITVTGPAQPDLAEYVGVGNTNVAAGGSTTIDAYAMNIGSGVSGASTARIYLSTDVTVTTSDTVLATLNSGALTSVGQNGYTDHQTLSVSLAANLAPGTYYIGGIADYNNQVSESNEANNTYNVTKITVTAPAQPDLSEYVGVSNTTVAAGGSTTIDAYAMNVGNATSGASSARIYLSTDATITTSDTVLATVNSGALTSVGQNGYTDHQTLSVSLAANLAPGTYYIGGIADYNDQVSESNEANNTYNITKITVTAPAQPDLSEYVGVGNTTVAAGGTATIDAYAMNIGSGVVGGSSTARIYLSTDATISTSDTVLATLNSGALAAVGQAGYTDHQTLSVALSASLAPGTYYIGGIADYNGQVSESNETNNTYNVTRVTVTAPAPSLSTVVLNDAAMWAGGALTVVNTFVGNGGTVSYYAPVTYNGFTLTNINRSDFAFSSFDSGFAAANNYFFDGLHVIDVPAGGNVGGPNTIHVQQQSGALFSAQSIDLDTLFAANGQTATFTGVKSDNSVVSQTFSLDNTQGMQTFHFNSNFSSLKSLDFAPSMNEFFDNFTLATSTSGASAAATIGAGATLEINTAFSAQVTFATGNGLLKLDDPTSFTGQIAGIAGTGDVIDFAGFASNTTTASYSAGSGNLTVSDAAHSVSIKLVGDYSLSSFTVSSDGHGGVLVVDPPLNSSPPESHVVESGGRDQTLTGHSGSDTFMFKADFGNATIANFEPGVDVIEAEEALFATHEALFAATHDDGQGNVVIVVDQNNSITLNNVALIGLSQNLSDLHLV